MKAAMTLTISEVYMMVSEGCSRLCRDIITQTCWLPCMVNVWSSWCKRIRINGKVTA